MNEKLKALARAVAQGHYGGDRMEDNRSCRALYENILSALERVELVTKQEGQESGLKEPTKAEDGQTQNAHTLELALMLKNAQFNKAINLLSELTYRRAISVEIRKDIDRQIIEICQVSLPLPSGGSSHAAKKEGEL